jgi:hypothetical protein
MPRIRTAASATVGADDGGAVEIAAAALFEIVWQTLADVLGTAAVAAIVRRAVGRAAADCPELVDLVVLRQDLDYRYTLPLAWSQKVAYRPRALRLLVAEIGRLLVELTGTVVIRRLEEIPELRASGLVWQTEEAN